jgi:hypothetical protein
MSDFTVQNPLLSALRSKVSNPLHHLQNATKVAFNRMKAEREDLLVFAAKAAYPKWYEHQKSKNPCNMMKPAIRDAIEYWMDDKYDKDLIDMFVESIEKELIETCNKDDIIAVQHIANDIEEARNRWRQRSKRQGGGTRRVKRSKQSKRSKRSKQSRRRRSRE